MKKVFYKRVAVFTATLSLLFISPALASDVTDGSVTDGIVSDMQDANKVYEQLNNGSDEEEPLVVVLDGSTNETEENVSNATEDTVIGKGNRTIQNLGESISKIFNSNTSDVTDVDLKGSEDTVFTLIVYSLGLIASVVILFFMIRKKPRK